MKILTAAQMREVDRLTTERYGVPSLQLMENAALSTVDATENKFGQVKGKRVLIIAGRGNNGGDGAAAARHFHLRGAVVDLILLGLIDDTRGDARRNFEVARAIYLGQPQTFRMIEIDTSEQFKQAVLSPWYDILVDAIFGTGLTRPAGGIYEEAINYLNEGRASGLPLVSIDIPSGISSDSQELIGPAVRADLTVTFTALKVANAVPPACHNGGELVTAGIGSPPELIGQVGANLNLTESADIQTWLASSRRGPDSNKGDAGKVLIVAGSRGKTGAACLAGAAAMRAGAGTVTVATAESSQPVIASHLLIECMTEPLAETETGTIAQAAADRVVELAAARDVLAIGPGIGSADESTRAMVRSVVMKRDRPTIIDADGLNSLAPWVENLRGSPRLPIILTPHPGEMARLANRPISYIVRHRVDVAREFATQHSVILVLKGNRTVIAAPDGEVYVNQTGNAGMATGGTGDVLTGIIAGLLAQKPGDALGATIAGVYLHGLAGDMAALKHGARAMIASDITSHLGEALLQVGGDQERLIK
jgi:hydroxyethylthiazole kinase-like uncharacterized protein yjeF